jgi:hypothetical protein
MRTSRTFRYFRPCCRTPWPADADGLRLNRVEHHDGSNVCDRWHGHDRPQWVAI